MSDIVERLRQIANAIADHNMPELTMRIPAEPDRDADLVVMRAANEIELLRAKLEMRETTLALRTEESDLWENKCGELEKEIELLRAERDYWEKNANEMNAHWKKIVEELTAKVARLEGENTHTLVPKEPSEAMINAGISYRLKTKIGTFWTWYDDTRELYLTMLKAGAKS